MTDLRLRAAEAADARSIADIIRSGVAADFLKTTIYGCSGVTKYIADNIRAPLGCSDTVYFVATVAGSAVGCVEMRRLPAALCLNYVAVLPHHRSAGLGTQLLRYVLTQFPDCADAKMVLDVLSENEVAIRWYTHLGFAAERQCRLWHLGQNDASLVAGVAVAGYPQAEITQRKFGFSEFTLITPSRDHRIGRIGSEYFRLRQTSSLSDPAVLPFLARLEGRRQVLCLLPDDTASPLPPGSEPVACVVRMSISIPALERNLALRPAHPI